MQLQGEEQLLIRLKTLESFSFLCQFGGKFRIVEPGTDQAIFDVLGGLVVRL